MRIIANSWHRKTLHGFEGQRKQYHMVLIAVANDTGAFLLQVALQGLVSHD